MTAALLILSTLIQVQADVITVGTPFGPGQCSCGTIQCALDAAASLGGTNEVRLTGSLTYYDESDAINVGTNDDLTVTGGFATCGQATVDTAKAGIEGGNFYGHEGTVLTIHVATGGIAKLRQLYINQGVVSAYGALGGGIHFDGDGTLDIADSIIANNEASIGGGIGARGTGPNAKLVIGANVIVSNNFALFDGGGVYVDGLKFTMLASGSTIDLNEASGKGGGLFLTNHACLGATASIGEGQGSLGPLYSNTAYDGGGVALVANDYCHSKVTLNLISNDPAHLTTSIQGNFASHEGGGIFSEQVVPSSVDQTEPLSVILVERAQIVNNAAPVGAAIKLFSTRMQLFGSSVSGNASEDSLGTPLDGAIIDVYGTPALLAIGQVAMRNNNGGPILHVDANFVPSVELDNLLIAENTTRGSVLQTNNSVPFDIRDSTIARNQISNGYVLDLSSDKIIRGVIIDQPGITSLHSSGGSTLVQYVVTSEQPSLGVGYPYVYEGSPRFVDPDHGDYTLQAASPAVDAAPSLAGADGDLNLQFRDIDLPVVVNNFGPRDIGAYERQALQPIVLNGDFDFPDLRLWTNFAGAWDGTSNATGGAGSGSWHYTASNLSDARVTVARQCVFLPGPGIYQINGWGHSSGLTVQTRDYAVISWEFRGDGGETCDVGSPEAIGDLSLGNSNNWFHPTQPASVLVDAQHWSRRSSIKLNLVGADAGVSAPRSISVWFDGITIDGVRLDNVIYANGFQ